MNERKSFSINPGTAMIDVLGHSGYTFDFGLNSSGYVRIKAAEKEGTELVLSHAEEIDENGNLRLNNLNILYTS